MRNVGYNLSMLEKSSEGYNYKGSFKSTHAAIEILATMSSNITIHCFINLTYPNTFSFDMVSQVFAKIDEYKWRDVLFPFPFIIF
jgi:hypothetical protein